MSDAATQTFVFTKFAMHFPEWKNCGPAPWRDPEWIHYRVHLYKQLTLRSLKRQSFKDLDILLGCCDESYPLMQPYLPMLESEGVKVVYDDGAQYLRGLPSDKQTLQYIRIDSDDLYSKTALEQMHEALKSKSAVQCVGGFWWDIGSGQVRYWMKRSTPFYGLRAEREQIKTVDDFYYNGPNHSKFRKRYRPRLLTSGLFLTVRHGQNHRAGRGFGKAMLHPYYVLPRFGVSFKLWRKRRLSIPEREE